MPARDRLSLTPPLGALFTLVFSLLLASPALAEPSPHRPPPPLPPPAREAPEREPDDMPRRSFELSASATVGQVRCAGAAPSSLAEADPCARLGASSGASIDALYRPWPRAAIGLNAQLARFGWGPETTFGEGASDEGASWGLVGLSARGYLFEDGTIDPYVGVALGVSALSMKARDASGSEVKLWREGLAGEATLGLDVWASSRLRVGPRASLLWQASGAVERCDEGRCLGASGLSRLPDHALRIGATLTLSAGDEL